MTDHIGMLERLELARARHQLARYEAETKLVEGVSLLFGSGTTELVSEDPVSDDGEVWTEVGFRNVRTGRDRHPFDMEDLRYARTVCRGLAGENGFAIGAMEARVSYIVGTGLAWRATAREDALDPKPTKLDEALPPQVNAGPPSPPPAEGGEPPDGEGDEPAEDEETPEEKALKEGTAKINAAIKAFSKANNMPEVEAEIVRRADRDGEVFVRTFLSVPSEPLAVRFVEPEDIIPPSKGDKTTAFGVKVSGDDVRAVEGYFLSDGGDEPTLVPALHPNGIPQILHLKVNVDMNSRRGWPTLYPVRRNFARADKLLRNMSYVAALQAAIAMIRKHDSATKGQVESFLDANADLLVTDDATGKETRFTGLKPGTVFDTGPGTTYESPVSSVNASNNIPILQADLREIAAQLQMPEFMLTANAANANLASSLVAEGPATKGFERLQHSRGQFILSIYEAALAHDSSIPQELLDSHDLVPSFPTVISRNRLQEAQRFDIERRNKIVSVKTWRTNAGYDHDTEEANIEEERKAAKKNTPPQLMQPNPDVGETPGPSPFPGSRDDEEEVGVPRK